MHEALEAYVNAKLRASDLLATIAHNLEGQQSAHAPREIHWGHVGDMLRIIEGLCRVIGEKP